MSFSSDVKKELARNISAARHCRIAELAGMIGMVGHVDCQDGKPVRIVISTERSVIANTMSELIKKLFGLVPECSVKRTGADSRVYKMVFNRQEDVERILTTLKIAKKTENSSGNVCGMDCQEMHISGLVIQKDCCRRAFIKGVFMTSGSISDPEKGYHFEIVCDNPERAELISGIIHNFGIDSKVIARKRYHVVYIKDGTMIVDMLNLMGAYSSLMDMENIRILKDIANNVNRKVNCEAANLNKTVNAAVRQIEDIEYIIKVKGIHYLPDNLVELAQARLEARDASLKELGEMINPPIGKSGVNHRLRKISEIADHLRGCR